MDQEKKHFRKAISVYLVLLQDTGVLQQVTARVRLGEVLPVLLVQLVPVLDTYLENTCCKIDRQDKQNNVCNIARKFKLHISLYV